MLTPMRILVAATLVTALPLQAQQPTRWIATWGPSAFAAAPRPPRDSIDRVPSYADRTVRQIVHTTLGGSRVRVRFTNEFGDRPLVIGAARLALRDTGASVREGSSKSITFGGRSSVILRRGAIITSDPVDLRVANLSDLAVSLWIKDTVRASTRHALGIQTGYVSGPGDFTNATSLHADTTIQQFLWLSGVDVVNDNATGVIVAFGNSITDGLRSPLDSNGRWPDVLARRLLGSKEPPKAVVNAGISGNGVISNITGPAALARFDRDVLMQPGITHIIVLEGINDLNRGAASSDPRDSVGAEELIFGYQQLIARAHERRVTIIGATLTPMGNMTTPFVATADARRQALNQWIRTSGAFDGVIDFDAIVRDPAHPNAMLPAYDSGDHLHPSLAGYKAMGEGIELSLFRPKR
jgi:lysophospholipase L1-like esterase